MVSRRASWHPCESLWYQEGHPGKVALMLLIGCLSPTVAKVFPRKTCNDRYADDLGTVGGLHKN